MQRLGIELLQVSAAFPHLAPPLVEPGARERRERALRGLAFPPRAGLDPADEVEHQPAQARRGEGIQHLGIGARPRRLQRSGQLGIAGIYVPAARRTLQQDVEVAGIAELFSAVLTGMKLSFDLLPMGGPDLSTPRGLGAFVMAIRPEAFGDRETFQQGMRRYVHELRASPARAGGAVLAPGDREWAEADRRAVEGVPLDPATSRAFAQMAERFGIAPPQPAMPRPE